jgi:hypothetical protein
MELGDDRAIEFVVMATPEVREEEGREGGREGGMVRTVCVDSHL